MRDNVVNAVFRGGIACRTSPVYQHDYGMILKFHSLDLPSIYEVHFSNAAEDGEAIPVLGNEDGVLIPDELLVTGEPVYAWLYLHTTDSDGETVYSITIPVIERQKPIDAEPTPVQQNIIEQAIAALSSGVETVENIAEQMPAQIEEALTAAKESGEFDGPQGPQGEQGPQGDPGENYVLTEQDKTEIAQIAAEEIDLSDYAKTEDLPTKVSDLTNDAGYITGYTETDPTVPSWAKAPSKPTYTASEVGALPSDAVIPTVPTNVSAFTNDAGYLTQHQDISGKANTADLATVAFSGDYDDLQDKPSIPTKVSDLTDDSGHYTKPADGIPASDLADGVLDVWSGLTYHTSTMSTDSDSFVLGGATDAPTEINKCLVTSTPDANVIPKFDYQGRLHSVTPEDEWDGSNAVATTEYVDNMISDNMPEIPTNVSEFNNDAGYLTSFTETDPTVPSWAKASSKPQYTASEVGAVSTSDFETAMAGKQDTLTFDSAPTANSTNPVTSGGVYSALTQIGSLSIHICTSQEYDSTTRVPTIQNPDIETIYLVPEADGETGNLFVEWIYANNAWEKFGAASVDLSNYATKTELGNKTDKVTSAVSGNFASLDNNGNLTDSGHKHSDYITSHQDISGKADKVTSATNGNFASLDSNGNLVDSGHKHSDYLTAHQTIPVTDVQVNGTSILSSGIANIQKASSSNLGVVGIDTQSGVDITSSGKLEINPASTADIKKGEHTNKPIVPFKQDVAAFYGLAKAAGDATQEVSSNEVGTYTASAKAAIQTMLGVPSTSDIPTKVSDLTDDSGHYTKPAGGIPASDLASGVIPTVPVQDVQANGVSIVSNGIATIPYASAAYVTPQKAGIISFASSDNSGIYVGDNGNSVVHKATSGQIKAGSNSYRPIVSNNQHEATFYGLAKAAGDATQAASDNAVGTYTTAAKAAIQTMLGVEGGIIEETVSGTTPTISANTDTRYVCGEVASVSFTPCATGSCELIFTSGTTAAVFSAPNTVKWPEWFNPNSLETSRTYDMIITNGVFGAVMSWAT